MKEDLERAVDFKVRDTSERRQQITSLVRSRGSVQVINLSERFGVSTQTIRKDLRYLSEREILTRSYGGAISTDIVGTTRDKSVQDKRALRNKEKKRIGKLAASLVKPGDSILLDSGTTTANIARYLPDDETITVVTNDFSVLSELVNKKNIKIIMLGGQMRRMNLAFYGAQTELALSELLVDKLFLGVDGLEVGKGITTHRESEAMLNRAMVKIASQVIAVTDSSKFNHVCLHKIVGLDGIDILISDDEIPERVRNEAERIGFKLLVAEKDDGND